MKNPRSISVLMLSLLCPIAQAHRPIFSERAATDPNTAVLITQPAISQVIYREITDQARRVWLVFDANEGFELFIQIGVPVLDRLKNFRPAMLVVGPGLPEESILFDLPEGTGAKNFPTDSVEEPRFFHEHFTGTDSWILRSETVVLPKSGRYYLVAYVPSGEKGKLWLSVGRKEFFGLGDWAEFEEWKKRIRKFHEVSEQGGGLRIPILSDIGDLLRSAGTVGVAAAKRALGDEGWKSLFNGKDLSGWEVKCLPQDREKVFWKVNNGAIECNSIGEPKHNYVWLLTEKEFANFELRLKFQVFKFSKGNSGVQFRSRYDDSDSAPNGGWLNGPQIDIHPPMPFRTGLIYDETRGVRRWIHPSLKDSTIVVEKAPPSAHHTELKYADNDPDAWNTLGLICDGMKIKTLINGRIISDYDATGILDDEVHRAHDVGMRGKFALQLHTNDELLIRFKDMEILEKNHRVSLP